MRLLAAVVSTLALHGGSFQATLTPAGRHPAIGTRWPYAVKVAGPSGKPLAARITVQVVDPIGVVHPVEFYANKRHVTNVLFRGTFRDAVKWPSESRGFELKLRVTIRVGTARRVLSYALTPR